MGKYSMRFGYCINIQENKPKKVGIEKTDDWKKVGKTRKCSFKFDSGNEYNTQLADKVLLTATIRTKYDPTITEKMRVVLLLKREHEPYKILSAMPVIVNGLKVTQLKVQRWVAL